MRQKRSALKKIHDYFKTESPDDALSTITLMHRFPPKFLTYFGHLSEWFVDEMEGDLWGDGMLLYSKVERDKDTDSDFVFKYHIKDGSGEMKFYSSALSITKAGNNYIVSGADVGSISLPVVNDDDDVDLSPVFEKLCAGK
ncbi:Uncharacterised protein [Serratia ficaria]|uniref:hypothetical protein n=1 Tax=Serratia ficaria TaxID=61651 RepID=UPI0021C4D056|nr:hypothetical protein [Serratia ficaria]CAI2786402.1 Uncharacterised protein [Serratia ficaria]